MAQVAALLKGIEIPFPKQDVTVKEKAVDSDESSDASCNSEHTSHALDLLTYYKFHVSSIENLINHHNEAEDQLRRTRKDLQKAQNDLKDALAKLAKVLTELENKKRELDALQQKYAELGAENKKLKTELDEKSSEIKDLRKQLKNALEGWEKTKSELAQARNEIKKLTEDIAKVNKTVEGLSIANKKLTEDLTNANKKVEHLTAANKELTDENERLTKENTTLKDDAVELEKDYESAQESIKSIKEERDTNHTKLVAALNESHEKSIRIEKLEQQLRDANTHGGRSSRESEAANARAKAAAEEAAKNAAAAIKAAEDGVVKRFLTNYDDKNYTKDDIHIEQILYGNKPVSLEVRRKILDFASKRQSFKITDELMGSRWSILKEMPFSMVYAIGGQPPFKYVNAWEGEEVKFPAKKAAEVKKA